MITSNPQMTDELAAPTYNIYEWISDVENIERYEKGGYHLVAIEDSTVWLARD